MVSVMGDEIAGKASLTAHDRKATERGLRRYDRLLVSWLTKKFGDQDLAQDLAQETYLRVWKYAEHNHIENLKPLLFKTAANLAANEFRARGRWRASGARDSDGGAANEIEFVACEAPSPERAAMAKAEAKASLAAIKQLPERQRRAFVMNRFEGKNYIQIAEALKVSVSSVEKYIMAALTALRSATAEETPHANIVSFPSRKRDGSHE